MRRLLDETGDTDDALLGRLMRSAGPWHESDLAKRRVDRVVRERIAARSARLASLPRLRTVMAAAGLLLVGGVAGATMGRAAWDRIVGNAPAVAAPTANQASRAVAPHGAAAIEPAPEAPVAGAATAPATAVPAAIEVAPRGAVGETARATRRTGGHAATMSPATALSVEQLDNINALMTRAQRELRSDPAFARVAAEDYLRMAPDGMLVEAAMYVACQAAFAAHDGDAARLAERYLGRFPSGQWVTQVRNLAGRGGSPGEP